MTGSPTIQTCNGPIAARQLSSTSLPRSNRWKRHAAVLRLSRSCGDAAYCLVVPVVWRWTDRSGGAQQLSRPLQYHGLQCRQRVPPASTCPSLGGPDADVEEAGRTLTTVQWAARSYAHEGSKLLDAPSAHLPQPGQANRVTGITCTTVAPVHSLTECFFLELYVDMKQDVSLGAGAPITAEPCRSRLQMMPAMRVLRDENACFRESGGEP